jgi:predicted DNA-binding antitoxin AbrB/MazE fold protein
MARKQTVEAIYEGGVLRPLETLANLPEHCQVKLTIEFEPKLPYRLMQFAGILSDEEAAELQQTIAEEFEKIDPHAW